ncbi:MAG TPA: aldehyde dehydrogenase family protein, partial [Acidimicrobiales bacterium]|nr:aldehyde dehydrogenase family protein [Acidimicrobiales bacterium]
NPATGRLIRFVQGGGEKEVDGAVRAAHEAQRTWSRRSPRERGKYLLAAARLIREHADELAALESQEMGKPVSQARNVDVEQCIVLFEYYAGLVEVLPSQVRDQGYALDVTMIEPYGVIAGIVPFNWPPLHVGGKAAPALAVGNGVVLKPPEQCPLVIMRIVELVQSVLPDDVLQVVPGGAEAGATLVKHPLVGKVIFTGSAETGRQILRDAADTLTPTLMELGGKNPIIVFDDADLEEAVVGAIEGGFFNQGEACTASSRILVEASVHDEVVERLSRAVPRLRVGDGADPATHVGPMVNADQQRRVLDYIEIGIGEGATVAAQAAIPDDPELAGGYFVPPTMFTGVAPTMRIAKEEIFGPVICVIAFSDEEEAVDIANGTPFGLIAGVYSRDSVRTLRVSRQLKAGIVFVNNFNRVFVGTPFGGTGDSGFGRVHAPETLREFGRSKSIRLPSGEAPIPRWSAADDVLS